MRTGIDEAGRGPVLGPLVVVGVSVEDEEALVALGVRDSKRVPAAQRPALAREITALASKTATVVLSARDIDDARKYATLNDIEVRAFAAVGRRLPADEFVLDAADVWADRFGRRFLRELGHSPPPRVLSVHKADAIHPVVSAASILAKVERDRQMARIARRLERETGLTVGSGYPSDPTTVTFLQSYVKLRGDLPDETRTSWAPARALMAARSIRPLTEF